ncbi:MAG: neutral/alkaline ceramidase [Actinomycetota bacterium]|nr:neutral/alkaline ceramidase [Actinomycetota bacterium]
MADDGYLVGRGIADITGEAVDVELLGYGKKDQRATGIHTRLRSRAFVIADATTGRRILLVVSDLPMVFDSIRQEILRRLSARYGDLYTDHNVTLTATHTHCGPGGYSHHLLYILSGFHPKTFAAIVDGVVEAIGRAHDDVAPATLTLARGELRDASVNRSRAAFERNPDGERAFFPDAIDPQTTLLRIEREGRTVGAVNWFATHGTSMTNRNTLISGDNKGYASYHWERVVEGGDYLAAAQPPLIAAFAQTNTGDMSPNLNLAPGSGPTGNEFENTRLIGRRQYEAAARLAGQAINGGVDSRTTWINLADTVVAPEFTGDGRAHRTSRPAAGAAAFAGTDEGPGFRGFRQGLGQNPLWEAFSRRVLYRLSGRLADAQAPKAVALPGNPLNARAVPLVQERVPVQLIRIGPLHLLAIPGEVTIVAGLRLRRRVAAIVGADIGDVLVAGYANAYIHYITTPEEYDAQRYEGGSTLFGRWELGAFEQAAALLARALRDGTRCPPGEPPPDLSAHRRPWRRRSITDQVLSTAAFGDVLLAPRERYVAGEQALVAFVGAYPNNDQRRGDTFVEVQHAEGGGWRTVADDGDWSTKFRWARIGRQGSRITVSWDIPIVTAPGRYRIRYRGDASDRHGRMAPFIGVTAPFEVGPTAETPAAYAGP